jgi:anaerobic selenocysteine-containing dehydrogenase
MDRRDFIKVTAGAGASATLAGCGNPETSLIQFIPEEPLFPGIATWRPSICSLCSAGCGLQVRILDGDAEVIRNGQAGTIRMGLAKKLEGNPAHPISQGKLCARGQAGIQVTYHPDRIRHPLRRAADRGTGPFEEISWDQAMAEFVSRLDGVAESSNRQALGFLTRPLTGQLDVLVSEFLQLFGAPQPIVFDLFADDVLREANRQSFGYAQLPTLDLARSRYVLSFGADFLGTWNSPVSQSVAYGEMRQGRPGVRAKFVQIEPRMSQTGANADEWVPVKPGTEGVLALGLAHVILKAKLRPPEAAGKAGALISGWNSGLDAYSPEEVAGRTGVAASRIIRLAHEFAEHGPAMAFIGGAPLAHTNAVFQALAVNALHALVGNIGQPGGIFFTPQPDFTERVSKRGRPLQEFASDVLSASQSPVQMLLLHETNPVYASPPAWRISEALSRIPYIVSFGNFLDETSILADLILPNHSSLESWIDHVPESGTRMSVASVAAPVMRPLHQTRAMADVLLDAGRRLKRPLSMKWNSYEDMLRSTFESLPADDSGAAGAPDPWAMAQQRGGWWREDQRPQRASDSTAGPPSAVVLTEAQFDGEPGEFPLHFLPYASPALLDGSLAHLPWLQELPDVLSTAMWSSWVEIHPGTAAKFGIADGDIVQIQSRHGSIHAPAVLSPGISPDVIAMPVGQGHQTFTRYASGRGASPIPILAGTTVAETKTLAWAATRVRVTRLDDADPSDPANTLILFSGGMREKEDTHR